MPDPRSLSSDALLALVQDARWFGAKDTTPEGAEIVDLPVDDAAVTLAVVEVRFGTGTHDHYLLDFARDGSADVLERPEVAALGREPALLAQPGGQRLLGQRAEVAAHEVSRRHRRRPPRRGAPS